MAYADTAPKLAKQFADYSAAGSFDRRRRDYPLARTSRVSRACGVLGPGCDRAAFAIRFSRRGFSSRDRRGISTLVTALCQGTRYRRDRARRHVGGPAALLRGVPAVAPGFSRCAAGIREPDKI